MELGRNPQESTLGQRPFIPMEPWKTMPFVTKQPTQQAAPETLKRVHMLEALLLASGMGCLKGQHACMTNGPSCTIKLYNCLLISADETEESPQRIIHKHLLLRC